MASGEDILKKNEIDNVQSSDPLCDTNENPDNVSLPGEEDKNELPDSLSANNEFNKLNEILSSLEHMGSNVHNIAESTSKITGEIKEIHKLYFNEFSGRLQSMQKELEQYREIDKGRVFDGILRDVAKLYSNYESILDEVMDEKLKKRIGYMFLDILQILEINGVCKQKSKSGDKRTRHCKIAERVSTDNPDLHDTLVKSHSTGFYIENRSLVEELVDIYIFTEAPDDKSVKN